MRLLYIQLIISNIFINNIVGNNVTHNSSTEYSIIQKEAIPELPSGLMLVTPSLVGYNYHIIDKSRVIKVPLDPIFIPAGSTIFDVYTFLYNSNTKSWEKLEKIGTDPENNLIHSKANTEGIMINGVIKTPEAPEISSFTPTFFNDIESANPASKVNLIQPPTANQQGSATLTYPIELPPGRNGMMPEISISYSSDRGSGHIGEGWEISGLSSITVDTRWGVPRYLDSIESENYLIDGEMLLFQLDGEIKSAKDLQTKRNKKNTERQFKTRRTTDYRIFIRSGAFPNYKWTVKYPNGQVDTYEPALSSKDNKKVAEWKLSESKDKHRNYIEYKYKPIEQPLYGNENIIVKDNVIESIQYTKNYNNNAYSYYTIDFNYHTLKDKRRKNLYTNSAMYGFLTSSNLALLDQIHISYEVKNKTTQIRLYDLHYNWEKNIDIVQIANIYDMSFNKSLLDSITQHSYSGDSKIRFNSHEFNYKTISSDSNWFNPPKKLSFHQNIDSFSLADSKSNTPLSVNMSFGIGFPDGQNSKSLTLGGKYSTSKSIGLGQNMLVDLSGDGIKDLATIDKNNLFIIFRGRINKFDELEITKKADTILNITNYSKTVTKSTSYGAQVNGPSYSGIFAGIDKQTSNSITEIYLKDVNRDGLMDIVVNSNCYFNKSDGTKISFSEGSSGTGNPLNLEYSNEIKVPVSQVVSEVRDNENRNNELIDIVKTWTAPVDGNIRVRAPVQRIAPDNVECKYSDSLRVSIQINDRLIPEKFPAIIIASDDFRINYEEEQRIDNIKKGDIVYFRLEAGVTETHSGVCDVVSWDPVIAYDGLPENDVLDVFADESVVYKSSEDYIINGSNSLIIPKGHSYIVNSAFEKEETADGGIMDFSVSKIVTTITTESIIAKVLNDKGEFIDSTIFKTIPEYTKDASLSKNFQFSSLAITKNQSFSNRGIADTDDIKIELNVYTSSNISSKKLSWTTNITLLNSQGDSVTTFHLYPKFHLRSEFQQAGQVTQINSPNRSITLHNLNQLPDSVQNINLIVRSVDTVYLNRPVTRTRSQVDLSNIINNEEFYVSIEILDTIDQQYSFPVGENKISFTTPDGNNKLSPLIYSISSQDSGSSHRNWSNYAYYAPKRFGDLNQPFDDPIKTSYIQWRRDQQTEESDEIKIPTLSDKLDIPMYMSLKYNQGSESYTGINERIFFSEKSMGASRMGSPTLSTFKIETNYNSAGSLDRGIVLPQISESESTSKAAGVQWTSTSAKGSSKSILSTTNDMNGDGYGDIVVKDKIQYTNPDGGLYEEVVNLTKALKETYESKNSIESTGLNLGGFFNHAIGVMTTSHSDNTAEGKADQVNNTSAVGGEIASNVIGNITSILNSKFSANSSVEIKSSNFVQVNQDGLPDILLNDKVYLNLGYSFSPAIPVDKFFKLKNPSIIKSETDPGLSPSINIDNGSFTAGVSQSSTTSETKKKRIDINGDGLQDILQGESIYIASNAKDVYVDSVGILKRGISVNKSDSKGIGGSATVAVNVFTPPIKLSFTAGPNKSSGNSKTIVDVDDYNADGFPDIAWVDDKGDIQIRYNQLEKVNKLDTVTNPLGGVIAINYKHNQRDYGHPGGKLVMESYTLDDQIKEDRINPSAKYDAKTQFEFSQGKYDRFEREFLGFGKVETINLDYNLDYVEDPIRKTSLTYDTSSYYTVTNLLKEEVSEPVARKTFTVPLSNHKEQISQWTYKPRLKTTNTYYKENKKKWSGEYSFTQDLSAIESYNVNQIVHSILESTENKLYEKNVKNTSDYDSLSLNSSYYIYDNHDINTTFFYNDGSKPIINPSNPSYDYKTNLIPKPANYNAGLLGLIERYTVRDVAGKTLRHSQAKYNSRGQITHLSQQLNNSDWFEKSFTYQSLGMIDRLIYPATSTQKAKSVHYEYDPDFRSYVKRISIDISPENDKWSTQQGKQAYTSSFDDYDYKYGLPILITDINHIKIENTYDEHGRLIFIFAPQLPNKNGDKKWLIRNEYSPNLNFVLTSKYNADTYNNGANPQYITLRMYNDGFGSIVQQVRNKMMKDHLGSLSQNNYVRSGLIQKDALGRAIQTNYEMPAVDNSFKLAATDNYHTQDFDILDRPTSSSFKNIKIMDHEYSIENLAVDEVNTAIRNKSDELKLVNVEPFKNLDYLVDIENPVMMHKGTKYMLDIPDNTNRDSVQISKLYYDGSYQLLRQQGLKQLTDKNTSLKVFDTLSTTDYRYNPIHELIYVDDSNNNISSKVYDIGGRVIADYHPDVNPTKWTITSYDTRHNLIQITNTADEKIIYQYDDLDRTSSIIYPSNPYKNVTTYYGSKGSSFNAANRPIYQEDSYGYQRFEYDELGNVSVNQKSIIGPDNQIYTFEIKSQYDYWNRVNSITYVNTRIDEPGNFLDKGDVISYTYNSAGDLDYVKYNDATTLIDSIGYNEFSQKTYQKYSNGIAASYIYDVRKRLTDVIENNGTDTLSMATYAYDNLNNITSYSKKTNFSTTDAYQVDHIYRYDALNRLSYAQASVKRNGQSDFASYQQELEHDEVSNIKVNNFKLSYPKFGFTKNANYTTSQNSSRITSIDFDKTWTIPSNLGNQKKQYSFGYDNKGNIAYKTTNLKNDNIIREGVNKLNMIWDETNRMKASDRNGLIANYLYDAQGIRIMKVGMSQENIYLNSQEQLNLASYQTFSLYPSKYQTLRNSNGQLTNHYYIGNERFASRTDKYHFPGPIKDGSHYTKDGDNNSILPILSKANISQNLTQKTNALSQRLTKSYNIFGYAVRESVNYDVSQLTYDKQYQFPENDSIQILDNISVEDDDLHFYHPNHLGSTAFVSDAEGVVVQYIEYLPLGGTFLERRKGYNTQYTYTAKEKDIETGLYDYGARYYDDEIGRFYGVDPMKDKYLGLSTYNYVMGNYIKFVDPDGRSTNVKDMGDGKYKVIGGNLEDKDKGIYDKKGKKIGESLTMYSFYSDDNHDSDDDRGWKGVIDTKSTEARDFFQNEVKKESSSISYFLNAGGSKKYDVKSRGGDSRDNNYRGSIFETKDGMSIFASARDAGNFGAGYKAKEAGLSLEAMFFGFDAYEILSSSRESGRLRLDVGEGQSSKRAQQAGWNSFTRPTRTSMRFNW